MNELTYHASDRIARLRRRADWLERRLAQIDRSSGEVHHHDKGELSALRWGLAIIEEHLKVCCLEDVERRA